MISRLSIAFFGLVSVYLIGSQIGPQAVLTLDGVLSPRRVLAALAE